MRRQRVDTACSVFSSHDFCAGKPVVQKAPVAIGERPPETRAAQRDARDRIKIAARGLCRGNGRAVLRNDPDVPGFHRQCLAATGPAENEISGSDGKQVELQKQTCERRGKRVFKDQKCPSGYEQDCRNQQCLIAETAQPARKAGGRNGCRRRLIFQSRVAGLLRGVRRGAFVRGLRLGRERLLIFLPLRFYLLALLGRQFAHGLVFFTRNAPLLGGELGPVFHLCLQPLLLFRFHFRISVGDLYPFRAAYGFQSSLSDANIVCCDGVNSDQSGFAGLGWDAALGWAGAAADTGATRQRPRIIATSALTMLRNYYRDTR
jgi:hypothetical protein